MTTAGKTPQSAAAAVPEVRWLHVQHDTVYDYDAPVELAHHLACLRPRATDWQRLRGWCLTIDPAPDGWPEAEVPAEKFSVDPWGNARLVFSHARVHERLVVRSSFEVGLSAPPPIDPQGSPAWEEVAASLRYHVGELRSEAVEFSLSSPLAPRDAALAAFGRRAFLPQRPLAEGALALMALIHKEFRYQPASTHVGTRATEALAARQGVCQDFAHVMIGACRSLGLAARYVSGYLLTHVAPGMQRLVGADASHAWVAVWCPVQGWLALDPTNKVVVGLDHVTLGWGRDYADVAPLRGVIRGGQAHPKVAVTVEPLTDARARGL